MTSTFTETATAVAAEAAGVLDMMIAMPSDLQQLLRAATAANPDPRDVRLATAFASLVARIGTASPDDQQQCAAGCGRQLAGAAFSTVLVGAHSPQPVAGMVLGVCRDCAATRDEVRTAAREALRRVAFPDLRPVDIHPAAGHA